MRKILILGATIAVVLFILWALTPQGGDMVRAPGANAANKVKQLLIASHTFYLDKSNASSGAGSYPKRFTDLVPTYLSEKDLQKLTANLRIDYFPPDRGPEEGQVVIVAHVSGFVIYGLAPFDVRWYELK